MWRPWGLGLGLTAAVAAAPCAAGTGPAELLLGDALALLQSSMRTEDAWEEQRGLSGEESDEQVELPAEQEQPLDYMARIALSAMYQDFPRGEPRPQNVTRVSRKLWLAESGNVPEGVSRGLWLTGLQETRRMYSTLSAEGGCKAPQSGDKVVYFMRHGKKMSITDFDKDPVLEPDGERQARNIRFHPTVQLAALNKSSGWRARLLMVSPMRRTLLTALLAFRGYPEANNLEWHLDNNLLEICSEPRKQEGEALLKSYGEEQLIGTYRRLAGEWNGPQGKHCPTPDTFTENIKARPEHGFIVVSHGFVMMNLIHSFLEEGQIWPYALKPDGKYKALSPPDMPGCWAK